MVAGPRVRASTLSGGGVAEPSTRVSNTVTALKDTRPKQNKGKRDFMECALACAIGSNQGNDVHFECQLELFIRPLDGGRCQFQVQDPRTGKPVFEISDKLAQVVVTSEALH